ncbi:HD domain-containing protein [Nocardiopsis exhalans]|uniref:HD domain-containing protein n=1 Tax=Nocardiopsis exhalans TaxID=163604 RepID=A0ABY5D2N5_9ACTN|nr:HD domain-containing protein [Nocardiopsis exhalans]USY17457.1 HD domain-containing protein [Nocardiopsis exhalans]
MRIVEWAERTAEALLSNVGTRLAHVRCAARRAGHAAPALPVQDRELLVAAALVHDIGYAPPLVNTGFHPLDGARWLRDQGADDRLVCLVAHHTGAAFEAERRGLSDQLKAYTREESATADALWYADLTSGPAGEATTFEERVNEILTRYEPGSVVHESVTAARPFLAAAVERTKERLAAYPR